MTSPGWLQAFCFLLASVLSTLVSATTIDTQKYTCRTFGSGVVTPFKGSEYYFRSNCPFTLTRFTHNQVGCDVTIMRGANGLIDRLEIIINKVKTVVQNGHIRVEDKSLSLPYDHTYQHIFQYGINTRLRSSLLPLSVTWHNAPGGIDTLKVELEKELSTDTGLCGTPTDYRYWKDLMDQSLLPNDTCLIQNLPNVPNLECNKFYSHALDCLGLEHRTICEQNIHKYESRKYMKCAVFKEFVDQCGPETYIWKNWRTLTHCEAPSCPGNLVFTDMGEPFLPTCSNPNHTLSIQELTSTCICPENTVLNDHADDYHCIPLHDCPCVFAGRSYINGDIRSTKCQSCICDSGKWQCSGNLCPTGCVIEGQFVTTFDGKKYVLPGKCKYVASQGLDWTITIMFSENAPSLTTVILQIFQETYIFSKNMVKFEGQEIIELHQSDHALVFWQSSIYVQVHTSFGINFKVQMSPEIQLYISAPRNYTGMLSGLCGNGNNDTTDDFTTSSGIIENSAQPFSQSWSVGACAVNIPNSCINTDNEIYAGEKCSVLNDITGIFAECHRHIPTDHYHTACIQRTCNCGNSMTQCLCVALSSYAKACANLGIVLGDWRKATNCSLQCQMNREFSYNITACNHTCSSLSGLDRRCGLGDAPVEGCGCPEGTHLNNGQSCIPKTECPCSHHNGATPPGSHIVDGRQCVCKDGKLNCSQGCGCTNGMVCVHCSQNPTNTTQKTCDSINKPTDVSQTCVSDCYCPDDQYEDHHKNCVSLSDCTCVYSGKVFSAGEQVETNCKTCICGEGKWQCQDMPCPGKCQVYGNGHYQTFDSKWYRFAGQCQYTLVEDDCGEKKGTFSVRVESVPCCDEAITCSRSIILDLQGFVTLTLSDMKVTRRSHNTWTLQDDSFYSTQTLGLYIIISVPSKGITLIWDKHTRLTIELSENWKNKVCGLCGNFDSNEMNDLLISGSALSSPLEFGNSWKAASPPCSDVTTEIFPCERNSYCLAWAQRRCMILTGDTFKACHLQVDSAPYYHACVQESCSCEFEGKFLGFCTAVAAYAEACSDKNVCVKWRTPDLCPVFCDYYNKQGQCSWHYEACGKMLSCSKDNNITHRLEGCYPRCSKDEPYYDENTGQCTTLKNCTCHFNGSNIQPGEVAMIESLECHCKNGKIICNTKDNWSTELSTTSTPTTTINSDIFPNSPETASTHTDTTTAQTTTNSTPTTTINTEIFTNSPETASIQTTATAATSLTTAETQRTPTTHPTTSTPMTTIPHISTSNVDWSTEISTTSTPTTTINTEIFTNSPKTTSAHTDTTTAQTTTTSTPTTTINTKIFPNSPETTSAHTDTTIAQTTTMSTSTTISPTTNTTEMSSSQTIACQCKDLKMNIRYFCGERWTEDCFHKTCANGKIEMTSVVCPKMTKPNCPRGQLIKVLKGCCEIFECDCRCELYGDPHYITFQGVSFDFLVECSNILVEERSPHHSLSIVVENKNCIEGFNGSCVKNVIVIYKNNTAILRLLPQLKTVQASMNNVIVKPPYEAHGFKFETTTYIVSIYLPEIRSFVSLSSSYVLVVSLAMEHFHNNTQGQCGVCGVGSCIRKGGKMEDDSCCEKTAYSWVSDNPVIPACASLPRSLPCLSRATGSPPSTIPTCPANPLCALLDHQAFYNCSKYVNLKLKKKSCEFDSCRNGPCSSLDQAAMECMNFGVCVDWRVLTPGSCPVQCPNKLVFRQCHKKLDDFCYGGMVFPGASLEKGREGCFCPSGQIKLGNHSDICVSDCSYCKGPLGEPKLPGEVWQSNCHICKCNKQTRSEECVPKPLDPVPQCSNTSVMIHSCCNKPVCVEKTCSYQEKTYQVGDRWRDAAHPCNSYHCSKEGIQTETRVCLQNECPKEDRIWDGEHCCFTCNKSCIPKMTSINVTISNCTAVVQMPVCQGYCVFNPRVVLDDDLVVKQINNCCETKDSETKQVTIQCSNLTKRTYSYQHITSCQCKVCGI